MSAHDLEYYGRMLDGLEDGTIERYDREESGRLDSGRMEYELGDGALSFAALDRSEQAAILRIVDHFLPTRTARANRNTGTSYAIKHAVERVAGFYVSNLQLKAAMRILGYTRAGDDLNPRYNVNGYEWRNFSEYARSVQKSRDGAEWRRDEAERHHRQLALARYFRRLAE